MTFQSTVGERDFWMNRSRLAVGVFIGIFIGNGVSSFVLAAYPPRRSSSPIPDEGYSSAFGSGSSSPEGVPQGGGQGSFRPISPSRFGPMPGTCHEDRSQPSIQGLDSLKSILDFYGQLPVGASPEVKSRTRLELLQILRANGSLSDAEVAELKWQLEAIDDVIKNKKRTGRPPLGTPEQEQIVTELGLVALQVKKVRDLFPRDTQLIAVLQFLKGKNTLLQAGTGQGKSLIVGMTAIMQSKLGLPRGDGRPMSVQILAPTENLAKAGLEENAKLFEACGVRARLVNSQVGGRSLPSDIMYGTPFDFEARALLEATHLDVPRMLLDSSVRRTVLMDESDSHLIDGASGRVLQSDPDPHAESMTSLLSEVGNRTSQFYSRSDQSPAQKQRMIQELGEWVQRQHPELQGRWKEQGEMWVKHALEVYDPSSANPWRDGIKFVRRNSLIDELVGLPSEISQLRIPEKDRVQIRKSLSELYDVMARLKKSDPKSVPPSAVFSQIVVPLITFLEKSKPYSAQFSPQIQSQFNRMIELAQDILSQGKRNENIYPYLFQGQIQYLSEGTGQIVANMKFSHGVQEFLELKHLGSVNTRPTISVRSFSMNRYLRESQLILGLSGTVGVDDPTLAFQRKIWNMERKPVLLPEFAVPQLRKAEEHRRLRTEDQWMDAVSTSTQKYSKKQPVLIIAENPEKARLLHEKLSRESGLKTALYMEMTDEHLLRRELKPGEVVITTNLGGRGSDYKYDKKSAPEGLHVIIGFDSDEERILQQARGRAGRAGQPGSWQQISYGQQLKQKPDIARVESSVLQTIGEDMVFETYRTLTRAIPSKSPLEKEMTQLVMSWMSHSEVSQQLKQHMTATYKDYDQARELVSQLLIKQWKDYLTKSPEKSPAQRAFLTQLNQQTQNGKVDSLLSRSLAQSLAPHFQELVRLRK